MVIVGPMSTELRSGSEEGSHLRFIDGCIALNSMLESNKEGKTISTPADKLAFRRKVDIRLYGKGNSKLPWRKAGQRRHLVDVVDSDQQVVNEEVSFWLPARLPRVSGARLPSHWRLQHETCRRAGKVAKG